MVEKQKCLLHNQVLTRLFTRVSTQPKKRPAAHAKGKAKAQPKGKAVMKKPTTKVLKVLKKPSQSTEKPENTKPQKKQKKWSEGLEKTEEKAEETTEESTEGPEEEVATCDEVVDPNTNFSMPKETPEERPQEECEIKTALASGALPEWLEEEWERSEQLKTGKTERQRMLVNHSIDHAQGKLVLNTDKAVFFPLVRVPPPSTGGDWFFQGSHTFLAYLGMFLLLVQYIPCGCCDAQFRSFSDALLKHF